MLQFLVPSTPMVTADNNTSHYPVKRTAFSRAICNASSGMSLKKHGLGTLLHFQIVIAVCILTAQ